ncbi:MAG: hypothetical protein Q9166_007140 [cf. Caloplaca sp. 2 TL-2023]
MDHRLQHEDAICRSAPWLSIPRVTVVGVEHPFLITNIVRAIDTLGGSQKVEKLVGDAAPTIEADLHLHPGDRNSKPIPSFNSNTNNVLLRITVPKRTGRKRKRGSDGEWQDDDSGVPSSQRRLLSDPEDARRLVRSMRGNPDRYNVEPVGSVKQTHRFRRLPDFVWSAEKSPFMAKMREHILPFDYTKLKNFTFDMSKGVQEENDIVPPPQWTPMAIPYNYSYRQNPAVKQIFSTAGPIIRTTQGPERNRIPMVPYDTATIPSEVPNDIAPETSLPATFRALLAAMREILLRRPVCTRRFLQNQMPFEIWKAVGPNSGKLLWQYVGYIWNSGPWRDSICALGVDPRRNQEMRWYQTLMFQLEPEYGDTRIDKAKMSKTKLDRELSAKGKNREGHLFDGRKVSLDGKVWQLCDITDPLLKSMLETNKLRDECHMLSDGWYPNGIMSKVRVVMKAKMGMILAGNVDDAEQNSELAALCRMVPDVMTIENRSETIFSNVSKRMASLAEQVRNKATRPDGSRFGAWGHPVRDQKPRMQLGKGVKGIVTFKQPGGRPGRKRKKQNSPREELRARERQEVLDPRLRDPVNRSEETERQATMRAFEDDSDGSDEGTSGTSGESVEDEEDSEEEEDDDDDESVDQVVDDDDENGAG